MQLHLEPLLPAEHQGSPQTGRPHPWRFPSCSSTSQGLLCLCSLPLAGLQLKNPVQACTVLLHRGPCSSRKLQQWPIWVQKCGCHTHGLETVNPRPLSGHRLSVSGLLIEDIFPRHPHTPAKKWDSFLESPLCSVLPSVLASWLSHSCLFC
jgi:hypothetical protein